MPAIQPAKLKIQIAELIGIYHQPDKFLTQLTDFLELYSDRTRRQGVVVTSSSLLNSLGIPKPVLHNLHNNLINIAEENPETTLVICDSLWEKPYIEFRLIAAQLLGCLPSSNKNQVLDRINKWKSGEFDDMLARIILEKGLFTLIKDIPDELISISENWIISNDPKEKQFGVLLLEILVKNENFYNLPLVFRLINPLIRNSPQETRFLIPSFISTLIAKDPQETAYILKSALQASENRDISWIIRKTIAKFPKDIQLSLREALRNRQQET